MMDLLGALPGAVAQGLVWGVMAIGVYITYKILDIADLTVDGTICTGAAVCTMMMLSGQSPWLSILGAKLAGGGSNVNTTACSPRFFASSISESSALCPRCIPSNLPIATADAPCSKKSVVPEMICISSYCSFPKNIFTGFKRFSSCFQA